MISPERILQYADIEPEAQLEEHGGGGGGGGGGSSASTGVFGGGGEGGVCVQAPPASWPHCGVVEVCVESCCSFA